MNAKYVISFNKCEHKALFFIMQAANLNLLRPLYCMFYIYTMGKHTTELHFHSLFLKDYKHTILSRFLASSKKCRGETIA